MDRAEKLAMEQYPVPKDNIFANSVRNAQRAAFQLGYLIAAEDLAHAFEYPFEVPDNDGHLVFTPMNNQTIRKELKLKKGERIVISIRKEK